MKFFTKENYEKLQVMANLVYPEDEKDFQIKKEYWQGFLRRNPLTLKYLPESIKGGIYDESIKPFLKLSLPNLLKEIKEWRHCVRVGSEYTFKEYLKHYETIKNELPQNVVNMHENYNFHDAKISALRLNNDSLDLELEYVDSYSLTFVGVKLLEKPDEIIGDCWINNEVHLSEKGAFDFQVLLQSSKGFLTLHELRVVADDVLIKKYYASKSLEV